MAHDYGEVVGRYKVDRVVGEHPFYVAETSQVVDLPAEDEEGKRALSAAESRVWDLLKAGVAAGKRVVGEANQESVVYQLSAHQSSPAVESARFKPFDPG